MFRAVAPTFFLAMATLTFTGCFDLFGPQRNDEPNVPATLAGRPVEVLGTVHVSSRDVTFNVWDSGAIDGDVISLYLNGEIILSTYTLTGTKRPIPATLEFAGYNYIALYAHNEGDISPNTAALSINDGTGEQNLVLSANLQTNGAYNIVVD